MRQATARIGPFLRDLLPEYDGATVIIVDHTAVHLALEHWVQGVPLARAVAEDAVRPWQPEWRYVLTEDARRRIERND